MGLEFCDQFIAKSVLDLNQRKKDILTMHRLIIGFFALVIAFPIPSFAQSYKAPSGQEFARVVPGGTTILPNGRLLTPIGDRIYTESDRWNVVLSPDG